MTAGLAAPGLQVLCAAGDLQPRRTPQTSNGLAAAMRLQQAMPSSGAGRHLRWDAPVLATRPTARRLAAPIAASGSNGSASATPDKQQRKYSLGELLHGVMIPRAQPAQQPEAQQPPAPQAAAADISTATAAPASAEQLQSSSSSSSSGAESPGLRQFAAMEQSTVLSAGRLADLLAGKVNCQRSGANSSNNSAQPEAERAAGGGAYSIGSNGVSLGSAAGAASTSSTVSTSTGWGALSPPAEPPSSVDPPSPYLDLGAGPASGSGSGSGDEEGDTQLVASPEAAVALAAYRQATARRKLVPVRFCLKYRAGRGQRVKVVGNLESLGKWSLQDAPELEWSEGDEWHTTVQIPNGTLTEYKYAVLSAGGDAVVGVQQGNNGVLAVRFKDKELEVHDTWGSSSGAHVVCKSEQAPMSRESRLLSWANDMYAKISQQRQELRQARVEIAGVRMELEVAKEEARVARSAATRFQAEAAAKESQRLEAVLHLQQARALNDALQEQLKDTTACLVEALDAVAATSDTDTESDTEQE